MNSKSHGLGLSICNSISQRINGSLKVNSVKGKVSTFTFTFVADQAEQEFVEEKQIALIEDSK